MNNVIFRPACPQDALEIAKLTIIPGGGIFEFLLEDFVKDMSLETLLALEIKKETGILSYLNVEVVELKDNITAIEFYERPSFREVKHIKVDFHPLMPHHGGMKLMQCFL